MALIIETGAQIANAESYVTAADVTGYATKRGLSLSSVADGPVEALIIRAMDFLEAQESRFQGSRVSATQVLAWPRQDVQLNGFDFPSDSIPKVLKNALCQLAIDADKLDLMPTTDGREVVKEKVDVIETTYAESNSSSPQPALTAFFNLLAPLLSSGGVFTLDMERA